MNESALSNLPPETLAEVDAFLVQVPDGVSAQAVKLLRDRTDLPLTEIAGFCMRRIEELVIRDPVFRARRQQRASPDSWRTEARANLDSLGRWPVAVEAVWHRGITGWKLELYAIEPADSDKNPPFTPVHLVSMQGEGGDRRLLNGTVPPWPEVAVAQEIGKLAREMWNVPFHFPSPEKPDDNAPRWSDLHGAK